MSTKITILGSGAMATACSILLAENRSHRISVWGRDPAQIQEIQQKRENQRLLPGIQIPQNVEFTNDIQQAAMSAELVVAAIPTKHLRAALTKLAEHLPSQCPIVSVIKGIENQTFMRPSQIITEVLGNESVVALIGPSHAEEFARKKPASLVAASHHLTIAEQVQKIFTTERFRVYTNLDLVGVELAGALKNVIAIAAGISDGLGYGDNAKSALLARGLVEMTRFGVFCGAKAETFSGLAGIGDLMTTCFSRYSRNRMLGERLGKGESLEQIMESMQAVAEGVTTTQSVYNQGIQHGIEMPIATEVYRVLFDQKSPIEATDSLMLRPVGPELLK